MFTRMFGQFWQFPHIKLRILNQGKILMDVVLPRYININRDNDIEFSYIDI